MLGWHGACQPGQPGLIAGNALRRVRGNDGQRVARRDEEVLPEDHIAVAVTVGSRPQVRRLRRGHVLDQRVRVHQVRIGMATAEVFERCAVDHAARGRAQELFEEVMGIGAGHAVHSIETHPETPLEQPPQCRKVEQALHHRCIVGNAIEDHNLGRADRARALAVNIVVGRVNAAVVPDGPGVCKDAFGHAFGGRTAVARIKLDAEVLVNAAGAVAG